LGRGRCVKNAEKVSEKEITQEMKALGEIWIHKFAEKNQTESDPNLKIVSNQYVNCK